MTGKLLSQAVMCLSIRSRSIKDERMLKTFYTSFWDVYGPFLYASSICSQPAECSTSLINFGNILGRMQVCALQSKCLYRKLHVLFEGFGGDVWPS